jgi:Carboxypeptidase regulatory-like domain/TonB dependent receptor/TonB-dependent Receptor Plug Domain
MRLFSAVLSLAWSVSILAQTTASLGGVVTAGGQPLSGVTVTISSPALQGTRSASTNADGAYNFAALPPGRYRVAFRREGLGAATQDVTLQLAQTSRADADMQPGISGEIVVHEQVPPVIETPQSSTTLPLRFIEKLPVPRNQLATAQFAPGVNGNTLSNGQLYIAGGPGYDNLVLVDGVVVTENTRGQMRPMYVEDAIEETTVITGAVPAEYGRFTGGVVSTITRSGGNELTGSLRDSLSNPKWSAQSPARESREDNLNHVWETTLGGAILRDRLWFFAAGRWAKNDTARQTVAIPGAPESALSYTEGNDQKRAEGKLSAEIARNNQLVASWFGIHTNGTNARFSNNIYDAASLTTRKDPESLLVLHDVAVVNQLTIVEGQYSARKFADRSGATTTDLIAGTVLLDRANNNTRFHSPTLCEVCDAERRNNNDALLKAQYFLGQHELSGGVDRFTERRYANNHQSGSDFSLFVTRAAWKDGATYPVVTPTNASGGGTFLRWTPILSPARANNIRTDSAFVSDRWTLGTRWIVIAGARWDRNHAVDADGVLTSRDAKISPRLTVQFDLGGDGRRLARVSYAEYASHIADSIASSNQAAGNAASIDFAYRGPAINGTTLDTSMEQAIQRIFDWFVSQGGTSNTSPSALRPNGNRSIPGYSSYFDASLASPYVRELSAGYGMQLGHAGYIRADYLHRDWRDFYAASVTTATRKASTPLGIPVDLQLMRNSNDLQRRYRALLLQARWTPRHWDLGTYYTYSKLRGNDDGESGTTGAVANIDPRLFYPEFFNYSRVSPSGWLAGDQRHRVRAWAGYELGMFSASVLHSYESGLPYSISGPINLTRYDGAPANPGYASIPNGLYYFSGRGALRTQALNSTDLALRFTFGKLFAQADVLNLFNNDAIIDPTRIGTTVSTAATSTTFAPFNPRTQTAIECPQGAPAQTCTAMHANYQLAPNFGQPLNNLAYQTPRTYRFSLGARF